MPEHRSTAFRAQIECQVIRRHRFTSVVHGCRISSTCDELHAGRQGRRKPRSLSYRASLLGLRRYRHALWQICSARGRRHHRGKNRDAAQVHALTGVCPTVALHVQWDFANGIAERRRSRGDRGAPRRFAPAPSIPISFRTRNTSSAPLAIPDREVRAKALGSRAREHRYREASEQPRPQLLVRGRIELSRHRQHPPAQERCSRSAGCGPRRSVTRSADADRIQAVRAGLLSHRYRRLGHGRDAHPRLQVRRRRSWSTPAIIILRRTSNRSSHGCFPKICSADSTSTTAATPMTI